MTIDVLAAAGEGDLEYQVYEEGATPGDKWVPNQPTEGDAKKATLKSDPIADNKPEIHLVVEARDKATKSVQKVSADAGAEVHLRTAAEQSSAQPRAEVKYR